MSLEIGPDNLPDLLAGLGMFAIAALLLWVAPNDRVHRAFALLQVVNGAVSLSYVAMIGYQETDPALSAVWSHMIDYFTIALPFAVAFFALRFLEPRNRNLSRTLALCLLGAVVTVLLTYAYDHSLVSERAEDGSLVVGPLGFLEPGFFAAFGGMALIFALAARRVGPGTRRAGLVLAALAFLLIPLYWSALDLVSLWITPERWWRDATRAAALLYRATVWSGGSMALGAAVAIVGARPLRTDDSLRHYRVATVIGIVLVACTAVLMAVLVRMDPVRFAALPSTTDGALRVVMTIMLAYALLRRQIFDKEVRLRFAISRSTVAAVFIAVFFVASEAAQQFFGETSGSAYLGIAAAGALVFAIAPLQRVADRVAQAAVPGRQGRASADPLTLYQTALEMAMTDGTVTREEERKLARIAHDLGLSPIETLEVRETVESALAKEVR